MAKASDNPYPSILIEEATEPSAPAAGFHRLYVDSTTHTLHRTDENGTEVDIEDQGGSSSVLAGQVVAACPVGFTVGTTGSFAPSASQAKATPILVPGPMLLNGLAMHVQSAGSGSIQWGLFDASSSASSATKIAGGSAAPGGTGWRLIAATSAPVSVDAGAYMLIWQQPASNGTTFYYAGASGLLDTLAYQNSYSWDDTPDFTTGWTKSDDVMFQIFLRGRLDATTQW